MRVVLLVTDLQPGGTPLRVVRWAGWLPRIGVEPVVGCLAPRGPLSDRLESSGIAHFSCDARGRFDLLALRRLTAALRRYDPDVLHAFLFHANLAARLVGRLDRRRAIVTSTATIEIERRWHRWLESFTSGGSDAHVVNSSAVARHVIEELSFPASRVTVIPNGVDIETIDAVPPIDREAWGLPPEVPLIAWAGRMDSIKRLDVWVEVFDHVQRLQPLCGVLIGDGPEMGRVRRDLERRGLLVEGSKRVGRIQCVGWVEHVCAWLKAADVFMLTSDTEGCPNVVLEAMASGCAVVASAVGGIVDLIETDRNGVLAVAGDVAQFSETAGRLCANPSLRQRLANQARLDIERTQRTETVVSALDKIYRTVSVPSL